MCDFSLRYKYYINLENSKKRYEVQDRIRQMLLAEKYTGYKNVLENLSKIMQEQINVGEGV